MARENVHAPAHPQCLKNSSKLAHWHGDCLLQRAFFLGFT
jgi:hypothetical protein